MPEDVSDGLLEGKEKIIEFFSLLIEIDRKNKGKSNETKNN